MGKSMFISHFFHLPQAKMPSRPVIKYPPTMKISALLGPAAIILLQSSFPSKKKSKRGKRGIPAILVGFIERIDAIESGTQERKSSIRPEMFASLMSRQYFPKRQLLWIRTPIFKKEKKTPLFKWTTAKRNPLYRTLRTQRRNLNEIKLPLDTNLISWNHL